MLTEVARQILHAVPEVGELAHARLGRIHTDFAQVPRECLAAVGVLEPVHQLREPIDQRLVEPEHLPHLARRAAAAIRDDVGRHRRTVPAVALVDVLNHLLAPIAARQVEIDVGPLAALLREKTLEEQVHADRIHRGDAQAVADGAVGGRSPALHEDAALAAEVHQVPDDQEVAGQIQPLDEIQLARDLRARAVVIRPVPIPRAHLRDLPEKRRHGFARRHGVLGEAVAQIGHRVLEPIGQRTRSGNGVGTIGEQRGHRFR